MREENKIRAKKSLGQNFLTSEGALKTIVETADLNPGDRVLEAGPGKGALAEKLLSAGARVIAVEKDDRLIPSLRERFEKEIFSGQLEILRGDILSFDTGFPPACAPPPACAGRARAGGRPSLGSLGRASKIHNSRYKIVANIPYYITGQFLRKFLGSESQPEKMVILVQKEVAERIVARDGKESLLSISVKAYGKPKYIETVKAGSFSPAPKVDSAILLIDEISKVFFKDCDEKRFFEVVKAGFAHKRKQIGGNLSGIIPKERVLDVLESLGISPKTRAEDITLEQWKEITLDIL